MEIITELNDNYGILYSRFGPTIRTIFYEEDFFFSKYRISFPPHLFALRMSKCNDGWNYKTHLFFYQDQPDILQLPYLPNINRHGKVCLSSHESPSYLYFSFNPEIYFGKIIASFWQSTFNNDYNESINRYLGGGNLGCIHTKTILREMHNRTAKNPKFWRDCLLTCDSFPTLNTLKQYNGSS